jgi:hypothetical protein
LNIHGANDVRQTEMHTAKPLEPEPGYFKVKIATENLERYKSPGTDQILAELFQVGVNTLCSASINLFIVFGIRKNCHSNEKNVILSI